MGDCTGEEMNIIEQIKALPDGRVLEIDEIRVPYECNHVPVDFSIADLKALAESHERLLKAAKEMHEHLAWHWQDDDYQTMFAEAEKLSTPTTPECEHNWQTFDNDVVQDTTLCIKCWLLKPDELRAALEPKEAE